MKVCMLTTSFPRFRNDLSGIFIYHMAKNLVKQGIEVSVVCPHSPGCLSDEIVDGIKVHRFTYLFPACLEKVAYGSGIPTNLKTNLFLWLEMPFFIISYFLKCIKFCLYCDIIHAHWTPSGLIGLIIGKLYRKPVVLTIRGSEINIRRELLKKISKYVFSKVDQLTAASYNLAEAAVKFGVPESKIEMVLNGIDTEKFRPYNKMEIRRKLNLPQKGKIVIFIGLLIPTKGPDYLLKAIPEVVRADKDVQFIFVGRGRLKDDLIKSAEKMGVKNRVRFVPNKPPDEIPYWLNAADIFVLPVTFDARPNIILEAMACGIPVVSSDIKGIRELIRDGETGFLIPAKNSQKLAEKILFLLADENARNKTGEAGRNFILKSGLTWEAYSKKIANFYTNLIRKKNERF